jgi:hypothetical protein
MTEHQITQWRAIERFLRARNAVARSNRNARRLALNLSSL